MKGADKDESCWNFTFKLHGSLSVDHHDHMSAFVLLLKHIFLGSSIIVVEYFSIFQKIAAFDLLPKLIGIEEIIILSVDFACSGGPSRAGNALDDAIEFIPQHPDKRSLSSASGGADYEKQTVCYISE